jgi:NADH-quinone oxidoreductase subunit M
VPTRHLRGVPVPLLILLAILAGISAFFPAKWLPIVLLVLPTLGVIVGILLPPTVRGKTWGQAVSATALFSAISLAFQFNWHNSGYQFETRSESVAGLNMQFAVGVDAISMVMVLLTALLHPIAVTASLRSVHARTREHYACMNFLLVTMLGAFLATDLMLFYMFFEASLIPLFFIVGVWGGAERRRAANKLFLYTFAASIIALPGILYLGLRAGTFYMPDVIAFAQSLRLPVSGHAAFTSTERFWVMLSLLAAFAVKTPLFPLHTWLPLAHTEAPTAGSVDLAALVLKLGTYGLLRLAIPIGLVSHDGGIVGGYGPVVLKVLCVLCLIGIVYTGLVAWVQRDIKRLIAYSSVSHLGLCVLGILALNPTGMGGSVLYMINHGITSGALFLVVGMIYNRYHTRDINDLSGLARAMPKLAFFVMLFSMAAVGLPGLNGFVSEFLSLLGVFTSEHLGVFYGVIAATGVILGALYMLKFATNLLWGPLHYPVMHPEEETHVTVHPKYVPGGDITGREVLVLTPLAIAVVLLGIFPTPLLRALEGPLAKLRNETKMANVQPAKPEAATAAIPAASQEPLASSAAAGQPAR